MHKITSYFHSMRKILTKKFWSQGTSPGSSGSGSWADVRPGACQFQILVIWGPNEPPVLVALQGQAKSLKPFPSRSGFGIFSSQTGVEKQSLEMQGQGPTQGTKLNSLCDLLLPLPFYLLLLADLRP